MKKLLVTGASGFVGSHLVEAAKKLGFEVHAVVRKSSKVKDISMFVDKFVYPNMNNLEDLQTLFLNEGYDYVIHAAALTKSKSEKEMFEVNVDYTDNLIHAAFNSNSSVKRFVFVSSLAAIGPVKFDAIDPITENSDYNPVTVYGRSKKAAELLIKEKYANKPISIFRPTAVYGPREKDLFILFDTLNKGLDPYIGHKSQKLSFVFVKDLVDLLLLGLNTNQGDLQFYNVSDGNAYSKYAMADVFKNVFPKKKSLRLHIPLSVVEIVAKLSQWMYKNSSKTPVIYPERLGELTAENWECSIKKAKELLGYQPKYNLEKGLTETLLWYKNNNWL